MVNPIIALLMMLLDLYWWVVVIAVVVSWLIAFNVINAHNPTVRAVLRILYALTEPLFQQIRRVVPPIGGMDLSPLIVLIGIWFIQYCLAWSQTRYGF